MYKLYKVTTLFLNNKTKYTLFFYKKANIFYSTQKYKKQKTTNTLVALYYQNNLM